MSDTITDFAIGDRIEMQQGSINGSSIVPIFIGTAAFSGVSGEMRYEKTGGQTLIHLDITGDSTANQTLTLSNGEVDLLMTNVTSFSFDLVVDNSVNGTPGPDTLNGTPGDDIINGLGDNDTITTFTGNDIIDGGDGDDTIIIDESGTGTIEGGADTDTLQIVSDSFGNVSSSQFSTNLFIYLPSGQYTLTNIERVEATTTSGDLQFLALVGDAAANTIDASAETVTSQISIFGGDGADTLTGGANRSRLCGWR